MKQGITGACRTAVTGWLRRAAIVPACAALAACAPGDTPPLDVDVIGAEAAPFETGVRLPLAAQLVRAATAEGLVALDGKGQVTPALADRWIVTDDGLSYIFRLRDGVWADGTAISGETVRAALLRALQSLSQTPLGREFGALDEVRAMAGRVVEIRLTRPVPDLLHLLAQPELGLIHKDRGSGPMTLKREGPLALLAPIRPDRLGLPLPENWEQEARSVRLHALPADAATRRFADGNVDVVLGGRFETYPLAVAASGLSRRPLKIDPVAGLFGLMVVRGNGPLSAPEVREAVAMAIDRDALTSALGVAGWTPTARIVGAGAAADQGGGRGAGGSADDRWPGMQPARRKADAAARIAQWKGRRADLPPLRLALPDGPGADRMFARLAQDLAEIGLTLERVPAEARTDMQLIDVVARVDGAEWYLGQLSCGARRGLCSAEADASLAAARTARDPARASALLAQAEAQLTAANVFIPLGTPVRWSLVRDSVAGFALNPAGFHPLSDLAMPPR